MLMEHSAYFVPGTLIVIIGMFCICLAVLIKSNDFYFWDYINKASRFAKEKSKSPDVDFVTFNNFQLDIVNAVGCFYKMERAQELKAKIFKPLQQESLLDVEGEIKKLQNAYEWLSFYLSTFYDYEDHSIHRSPDFKPSELKRYQSFLKTNK